MHKTLWTLLLMVPALANAQDMGAPVFGEPQRIVERLLYPEVMETVDWDGDGLTDVLAAGNGNNRLALFRGEAAGGFGWMELFPEETMADDWHDMRVTDWDGDGILDIVACEEGGVVWLKGNLAGGLATALQLRAGTNPVRMDIVDLNGDGHLDLTYCDSDDNEAVLLLGSGGGEVSTPTIEALNGATATAFADWNGDGWVDWLYSAYNSGQLFVRLGDGQGNFDPAELVADFGKLSAIGVLHDLEGDAFFLGVDDTYVFEWDPETSTADTLGLLAKAQQFDFGDLNGDGVLDVAVAAQTSGECGVIFGLENGGYDPSVVELESHQATDVAVFSFEGTPKLLTNARVRGQIGARTLDLGTGEWSYEPVVEGIQYVRNLTSGDVNGDGLDDAVIMVQGPNLYNGGPELLYVATAQPDGTFDVDYVATGTYFGYEVKLADYDGDDDLDAVVSDYNGDRVVGLRNDGSGHFVLSDTLIASINGCDDLELVDLDGDGDLDLAAAAWQGSDVFLALNQGNGQFATPFELTETGSRCEALVVEDFNQDGLLDVAACFENSGDLRVWMRTGALQELAFESPQVLPLASAQDVQGSDVDGDGDVDLLGVGYNESDVMVFENNLGVFEEGTGLGFGDVNGALMLTALDADLDGQAEVIVSEYGGARFRLFHAGTGAIVDLDMGNGPQNAAFGDFDGDGDQDVAMAFYGTGEIRWASLSEGMQPDLCFGSEELIEFLAYFHCELLAGGYTPMCGLFDFDLDGMVGVSDLCAALGMFGVGCND